jgi:hypothetical protein
MKKLDRMGELLSQAKRIAKEYREETGKPLGITGEVAEYEAAHKLGLDLCDARQPGYDAIRPRGNKTERIQIKGRRLPEDAKPGQRVGSIRLDHEWDLVVLVLLDEDFEPLEMYEANRSDIEQALNKPGSKARNERGALAVSKFKSISRLVWSRDMHDA